MNSTFATAIHLLVFLTFAQRRNELATSKAIATKIHNNPAVVRKLATYLLKAGIISTTKGAQGGYALALPAEAINLKMIFDAIEPLNCDLFGLSKVSEKTEGCGSAILREVNQQLGCRLAGVRASFKAALAQVSLQQVFEGALLSLAEKS
ncbi:MAG: Rrf2 family transcriptional regulator [Bernardetiaceae bacterium]|nr:Rrf2 family transcriptional regulator [Bernardetiaceae bacterium]